MHDVSTDGGRPSTTATQGDLTWKPELDESERAWLAASRRAARRRTQLAAGLGVGIVAGLVLGLRRWRRG